jgi:hypothetical protein
MSAVQVIRTDFKRRSRIDAVCPIHGRLTIRCDRDDNGGVIAERFAEWHSKCDDPTGGASA